MFKRVSWRKVLMLISLFGSQGHAKSFSCIPHELYVTVSSAFIEMAPNAGFAVDLPVAVTQIIIDKPAEMKALDYVEVVDPSGRFSTLSVDLLSDESQVKVKAVEESCRFSN